MSKLAITSDYFADLEKKINELKETESAYE